MDIGALLRALDDPLWTIGETGLCDANLGYFIDIEKKVMVKWLVKNSQLSVLIRFTTTFTP